MSGAAIRVLGPQDWAHDGSGALDGPGARALHRAFHERHLPLTPGLAAALARLMQARRPDAELPWGNGFRLCREALKTRGFGGTEYWRAALPAFPRAVAEPVLRAAVRRTGVCDLHGAAPLGLAGAATDAGANADRIDQAVTALLASVDAMGKGFWIAAGMALHAEAEAAQLARLRRERSGDLHLPAIDTALARLLFEIEPDMTGDFAPVTLRRQALSRSMRQRSGIRPKEGGVTGIRPSRLIEDLPDVLMSELLMPRIMVANRLFNEGMLVRHRPPSREPRRDLLVLAFTDRPAPSEAGAVAKAAWADAAIRLQIALARLGRPRSDLVHLDATATGTGAAALSAETAADLVAIDPMALAGEFRTNRLYQTGLLPGFATEPAGIGPGAGLLADLPDLTRAGLREIDRIAARGQDRSARRGAQRPRIAANQYEKSIAFFLLPETSALAAQARGNFPDFRAAALARLRATGLTGTRVAALILPDPPLPGAEALTQADSRAESGLTLAIPDETPPAEALAAWLGSLSRWMIALSLEVLDG